MTPSNTITNLATGLLPSMSDADLLDLVSSALNELDRRGDDIELNKRHIMSRWAEIRLGDKGFSAVFHDISIAEQASRPVGGAA
jgi:hypothetical protein